MTMSHPDDPKADHSRSVRIARLGETVAAGHDTFDCLNGREVAGTNERVTLWVAPLDVAPPPPGVVYTPAREGYAYDRFARALGEVMRCVIEVIERPPEEASGAGLVLMAFDQRVALELAQRAARGLHDPGRCLLLNGSRSEAVEAVDRGSALGAVLGDRYFLWQHGQDQRRNGDIFGPWSLAPALAPHLTPTGAIQTEHGVLYESEPRLSLPNVVALYLAACASEAAREP